MGITSLVRILTALSFLLAVLPAQAAYAVADAIPESADLLQFTSGGHALGFTAEGMYAATGSHALHVDFVEANVVQPQAVSPASSDGNPDRTQGGAAPLSRVTYPNLWDGITLTYSGEGGIYTTTYHLTPGADPDDIRLRYNAPLTVNEDGTLTIAFETGAMTESAPVAWQDIDNHRVPVGVYFRVRGQEVSFTLGSYDPQFALTIDPSLVWNSFLGGSNTDCGEDIAVDGSGNVYVTGFSYSTWGTPLRNYTADGDAFVAKLDPSGNLIWNTFLGGSGISDQGLGIAVDGNGYVYVTGWSTSPWGTPIRAFSGYDDAFVAKLNPSGTLAWHTFLGGLSSCSGYGIAVDAAGNAYVTGYSDAAWVETPLRAYTGGLDAFVAKLNSNGALAWHTFLGGGGNDEVFGRIIVDEAGNLYVAGESNAAWGSPIRAYSGNDDAFAAKLDSSGGLTWHTFLGGSGYDYGRGIAVDGNENVYMTGYSYSAWDCSPTTCTVRAYTGNYDAFAARLDPSGGLIWVSFLGGSSTDYGASIAADERGNIYVAGQSSAAWSCSPVACTDRDFAAGWDAFAARLDSAGNLVLNTFLGAEEDEIGTGIAMEGSGIVYVTGYGANWGSPIRAYTGAADVFVAKLDFGLPGAFAKLSPASGLYSSPTGVTLAWEASSDAAGYEYCYDTSDNGVCNNVWTDAGTDTSAEISGLNLSSTYYWQVRSTNLAGETYANGGTGTGTWWSLRTGVFADVPVAGKEWMRNWIEGFYNAGITTGCGASPRIYCPEREVTRAEMAVFLLRAKHGAGYVPPAATGVFGDVPFAGKEWMQPWIEQFYREGITTGCGAGPIYCPERNVTRAEMAVFVLRAKHGAAYVPPAATGVFLDVPVTGKEWMQPWIEQFYREGITTGCGAGPLYCPERNVTRAEMAVFLGRAYSIPLAP